VQMAEHARRRDEDDIEAPSARFMAEGLREMGFADAGGALNQHRLVALDEVASRQIEDLLAIDRRIETEVEAFERLAEIDGGAVAELDGGVVKTVPGRKSVAH